MQHFVRVGRLSGLTTGNKAAPSAAAAVKVRGRAVRSDQRAWRTSVGLGLTCGWSKEGLEELQACHFRVRLMT